MKITKRGKVTIVMDDDKELFSSEDDSEALQWAIDNAPVGVPIEVSSKISIGHFRIKGRGNKTTLK